MAGPKRAVQTGIGPVTVKVPKVRAKDGKPVTFRSALVPPYVRKAKSIEAALPWLYLKGISTGEMGSALKMLLGPDASGFAHLADVIQGVDFINGIKPSNQNQAAA